MNPFGIATTPTLDLAAIAKWTAENEAAIRANRGRERRERRLDSLYFWRAVERANEGAAS